MDVIEDTNAMLYDKVDLVEETEHDNVVLVDGVPFHVLEEFGANDIPDTMQTELQALGDLGDEKHWGVAKRVAYVFDNLHAEQVTVPSMKVYAAVAIWCKSSAESVRSWYGIYKEIPPKIFEQYQDTLNFSQFKALVPKLKGAGVHAWHSTYDEWYSYCAANDLATSSVDGMRAWIAGKYGAPSPTIGRHRRMMMTSHKIIQDPSVPDPIRKIYVDFIAGITRVAGEWGLDDYIIDA